MTRQRDWYLQQLGIIRWTLRHPAALRGEVATPLADAVRLIMVAQPAVQTHDPLIADILRALRLTADQVLILDYQQASMLEQHRPCNSWWLGVPPLALPGARLISPEIALLRRSAAARAELWQQIYQHEHDFLTHPG